MSEALFWNKYWLNSYCFAPHYFKNECRGVCQKYSVWTQSIKTRNITKGCLQFVWNTKWNIKYKRNEWAERPRETEARSRGTISRGRIRRRNKCREKDGDRDQEDRKKGVDMFHCVLICEKWGDVFTRHCPDANVGLVLPVGMSLYEKRTLIHKY